MEPQDNSQKRSLDEIGPGGLTHNPFAALSGPSTPKSAGPNPANRDDGQDEDARTRSAVGVSTARVWHERKGRGGKTVTCVVLDAASAGADREALASDMAKALGTGARVDGRAIVLQGDVRDRVARWLRDSIGVSVHRGT